MQPVSIESVSFVWSVSLLIIARSWSGFLQHGSSWPNWFTYFVEKIWLGVDRNSDSGFSSSPSKTSSAFIGFFCFSWSWTQLQTFLHSVCSVTLNTTVPIKFQQLSLWRPFHSALWSQNCFHHTCWLVQKLIQLRFLLSELMFLKAVHSGTCSWLLLVCFTWLLMH